MARRGAATSVLAGSIPVLDSRCRSGMATRKKPFDPKFDPKTTTLAVAQTILMDHAKAGAICPCCRQLVKLYHRPITGAMAYVLILLHRHFLKAPGWLHVPKYLTDMSKMGSAVRGGDWAKLRYWGLLEEKPEDRKDESNRAGFYRMTEKGHQFAKGEIKVAKAVLLYNDRFLGFAPGEVSIQDCLGKEFSYVDLMEGRLGGGFVV